MRKETGAGDVTTVLVDFNIIMVEDIVVEAGEETDLVVAVGFAILAVTEIGVVERDDPFEAVPRGAAEQQQGLKIGVFLQGIKDGFAILKVVEVEAKKP